MFINPLLVIALMLLNIRTVLLSLSFYVSTFVVVFVASQNQPLGAEAKPLSGGRFKARRIDYTKLAGGQGRVKVDDSEAGSGEEGNESGSEAGSEDSDVRRTPFWLSDLRRHYNDVVIVLLSYVRVD